MHRARPRPRLSTGRTPFWCVAGPRRGFPRRKALSPGRKCADTVRDAAPRCARPPDQLPALRRGGGGGTAQRGLATGADGFGVLSRQHPAAGRDPRRSYSPAGACRPGPSSSGRPSTCRRWPCSWWPRAAWAPGPVCCCSCRWSAWPSTASAGSRPSASSSSWSTVVATQIVSSPGAIDATTLVRRLILITAIGAMLSVAIQLLRSRLVESNAHTERLLRHEEALNAAVRQIGAAVGAPADHGSRARSSPWASWRHAGPRSSGRRTS